jgi:hypothetical protein
MNVAMTVTIERTLSITNTRTTFTAEVLGRDAEHVHLKGAGTAPVLYRLSDGRPAGYRYPTRWEYKKSTSQVSYGDLAALRALPLGPLAPVNP